MPSALENSIASFRAELLANDAATLKQITASYAEVRARLVKRIGELADAIAEDGRAFTVSEVMRWERAQTLLRQVEAEMAALGLKSSKPVFDAKEQAVALGSEHAQAMTATVAQNPAIVAQVESSWNRLNTPAAESMVARMSDGSPLQSWFNQFGSDSGSRLAQALRTAAALGTNPRGVARMLEKEVDVSGARLLTMARTEILGAYRDATLHNYLANADILDGWQWLSAKQTRTCLCCLALDGRTFQLTTTFQPSHVNCVIEGTVVESPPILRAYRRRYSGSVVEIETELNRRITVTPNHPVLTTEGWVAAGLINESHYLVCGGVREGAIDDGDNDHVPTLIEQKFDAILRTSRMRPVGVPASAEHFHGDGLGSEVEVVDTDRLLRNGVDAAIKQHRRELGFVWRIGDAERGLSRLGSLDSFRHGGPPSLIDSMSGFRQVSEFFGGCTRHSGIHPLATVSGSDALITERAHNRAPYATVGMGQGFDRLAVQESAGDVGVDDTALLAALSGHLKTDFSNGFGLTTKDPASDQFVSESTVGETSDCWEDSLDTFATNVTFDRVIKVSIRTFEGHVFNLSTESEWYSANGIIVHNCRCSSIPIVSGEPPRQRETGAQWFEAQPESVKRQMIPATAYDDFKAGKLQLHDFIYLDEDEQWGDRYRQGSVAYARSVAKQRGERFELPTIKSVPKTAPTQAERTPTIPASTIKKPPATIAAEATKTPIQIPKPSVKTPLPTKDEFSSMLGQAHVQSKTAIATLESPPSFEEQLALGEYKGFGFRVNDVLRSGTGVLNRELVDGVDSAMARSTLKQDAVVYRGMTGQPFGNLVKSVGTTFTDNGFVSTSTTRSIAEKFANETENGVVLRILVPKGANAIDMQDLYPNSTENELLLPRGSSFRVVAVDASVTPPVVDLEVLR